MVNGVFHYRYTAASTFTIANCLLSAVTTTFSTIRLETPSLCANEALEIPTDAINTIALWIVSPHFIGFKSFPPTFVIVCGSMRVSHLSGSPLPALALF